MGEVPRLTLAAYLLVLAGCMAAPDETGPETMEPPPTTWISAHERDHPLAGRIWRPDEGAFTDAGSVVAALAGAEFVLIGEKHDNPDHHRLQAWLVSALIARGRRPALSFEMLASDQVPALDAYLADHPDDAGGLGAAVGWDESGWPDWGDYAPIAQAALDAGLPVLAADLAKPKVRAECRSMTSATDKRSRRFSSSKAISKTPSGAMTKAPGRAFRTAASTNPSRKTVRCFTSRQAIFPLEQRPRRSWTKNRCF